MGTGAAIGVIDAAFSFEAGAGDEAAFTARGAIDEPLGFDAGDRSASRQAYRSASTPAYRSASRQAYRSASRQAYRSASRAAAR